MPANASAALDLFRKAAEAGHVPLMVPLAEAYMMQGTLVGGRRAIPWLEKATAAGDAEAWNDIGFLHAKGAYGPRSKIEYEMAMKAYRMAADGGSCVAYMNIGGLFFNGDGVPQDKHQAQNWFAKAESCGTLGIK